MNNTQLNNLAKAVIKNNIYLSLGTSFKDKPWVSPVCYFIDDKFSFYFASQMNSVRTKNILKNPKVSWAIFDSHLKEGTGYGVQIEGKAQKLPEKKLKDALRFYRSNFVTPQMLSGKATYRLFKLIPKRIYVNDPDAKVDTRVEVKLI